MLSRKSFVDIQWGGRSMVSLYLSILSGVVLALQYDPAQPYYSASGLDILVPFGIFWRSLHFYSSQLFFLFSILHVVAILVAKRHYSLSYWKWQKLILSLIVGMLLLFTGYILRADVTGSSAGRIAENILLSVPLLGRMLDSVLFSMIQDGMKRVYANHLAGLGIVWLVLSWNHLRRYRVRWNQYPFLLVALVCVSGVFAAPMEPEKIGVFHINGPWFFIGLQELLRHFQPFWAAIVWPAIFVGSLLLLNLRGRCYRWAITFAGLWLVIYAGLTVVGLNR